MKQNDQPLNAQSNDNGVEEHKKRIKVKFANLVGAPLEGRSTIAQISGSGTLELTKKGLNIGYSKSILASPLWLVASIGFGYVVVRYVVFRTIGDDYALVLAVPGGIVLWAIGLLVAPKKTAHLMIALEGFEGALIDKARNRVLIQFSGGRLLGLELEGSVERVHRYVSRNWPERLHKGRTSKSNKLVWTIVAILAVPIVLFLIAHLLT